MGIKHRADSVFLKFSALSKLSLGGQVRTPKCPTFHTRDLYTICMNREQIKKEFQENFRELRKVLNSWELIPGAPKDEFDGLNHQILSNLYKGADLEKITRALESELSVTYGLYHDEFGADEMASEIIEWWNLKLAERIQ